LDLRIQPADVNLFVDGQRWLSSDPNRFLLQLPVGKHKIEVTKSGYRGFETEVDVSTAASALRWYSKASDEWRLSLAPRSSTSSTCRFDSALERCCAI